MANSADSSNLFTGHTVSSLIEEIGKASPSSGERTELLANLKLAMGALTRADLSEQIAKVNLENLFECLASQQTDEVETTCEILKQLMVVLDPVETLQKYHESIHQGLSHPLSQVRQIVIAHLTRSILASDSSLSPFPLMVVSVINELGTEELAAATEAANFLQKYANIKQGKEFLLGPQATEGFKALLSSPDLNSAKKFRVYETLVNIAKLSPEHLSSLDENLNLLETLVGVTFESNDPLGQMNGLEILSNLVETQHGLETLQNSGVFSRVKEIGTNWSTIPLGSIFLPFILKFIGKVGVVRPPPDDLLEIVMTSLLHSEKDFTIITSAIEAFAYIGTTLDGKTIIRNRADCKAYFLKIREVIEDSPTEFRVRALNAMAILFGSDESNVDSLPFWFNILFTDVSKLFDLVRLPFPEIRLSGLNFMAAIAHLDWAQRHYLNGPGVMEFLLSRDVEPEKECVHAKFRLVSIIVDSPSAAKILSPSNMALLKLYVKQGPFYTEAHAAVATKGSE